MFFISDLNYFNISEHIPPPFCSFVSGVVLILGCVFAMSASLLLRCEKAKTQSDATQDKSECKQMLSSNGVIEKYIKVDATSDKLYAKDGKNSI